MEELLLYAWLRISDSSEYQRVMSMNGALKQLSSIYDRIDIVDYDEDCVKNVVARIVYPELNRNMSVEEIIQTFAREYIASEDRERYLALVDQKTLLNRIKDSGNGFITDYFRTKTKSGHYAWMQYYFIWIGDFNNQVLECMKQISKMASDALYLYYDEKAKRAEMSPAPSESVIHRSELWDTLMQDKNFGIFWKDEKRKFVERIMSSWIIMASILLRIFWVKMMRRWAGISIRMLSARMNGMS